MDGLSKTLRSMTAREILGQSFQIYKSNFAVFISTVILIKGPYLILAYILSKPIALYLSEEPSTSYLLIVKSLDLLYVPFISPVIAAVIYIIVSGQFLNIDIKITKAYSLAFKKFLPLLGTVLLSGILISSGFILSLLSLNLSPQITLILSMAAPFLACILWIWYAFVPQTVIFEDEGGFDAMKRSKYLIAGYFQKGLVLIIFVFLAALLIASLASYGIGKTFFFLGQNGTLLGEGAMNVLSILFEPFRIIVIALFYYDLRIRKEGFDIEIMAKEFEALEE